MFFSRLSISRLFATVWPGIPEAGYYILLIMGKMTVLSLRTRYAFLARIRVTLEKNRLLNPFRVNNTFPPG